MQIESQSFVIMGSTELADACKKTIARIDAARIKEADKYVQREMDRINYWRAKWWWPIRRPITAAETKHRIEHEIKCSPFAHISYWYPSYGRQRATAQKLLQMATKSQTVWVSRDDLDAVV